MLKNDLFFRIKERKELLIKSLIFKGKLWRKLFLKIKFSFQKFEESAAVNRLRVDVGNSFKKK